MSEADRITVAGRPATFEQRGRGPDLLLVHSLLAERSSFSPVLPALAERFRVTVPDLPGYGGTAPLPAPVKIDHYADWVAELIEVLGLPASTSVLGNGFGGFVATALAIRHGSRFGKLIIADYKTGTVPKQKDVESGLSPQLVLEALIAEGGKLYKMQKGEVAGLEYWKLSGGKEAGKITTVKADIDRLKKEAEAGLKKLVNEFAKAKTPYLSIPRPSIAPRYNDAAHLARIDEWKRAGDMKKAQAEKEKKTTRKRKAANTNTKQPVTRKRPTTRKGGPRNG